MKTCALTKSLCVAAALVAVLSGCGRKGDLERPGMSAAPATAADETRTDDAPERRFILDGLLD